MSAAHEWASTGFPRRAVLDRARPEPAAYLADLAVQALRHGMPARRPAGPVVAWAARRPLPAGALAAGYRRLPTRPDPSLDALLAAVEADWPVLAGRARRLPADPPALTALAVERSAARTVFVFGPAPVPLLVLKQPTGDGAGARAEAAALRRVAAAGVAPRDLGEVDGALVQEGLPGTPLAVTPVSAGRPAPPGAPLDGLGEALGRLAAVTAAPGRPTAQLLDPLGVALAAGVLSPTAQHRLEAARTALTGLEVTVVQHGDLSPQNWLVEGDGGFCGLVDWETAVPAGVPGFDALHAAVSLLEHGVGLVRWSPHRVTEAFAAGWPAAPWAVAARRACRASAAAAGVPDDVVDALPVAFFGRRLGRRLARPDAYAVGPDAAARMLEVVCAS